LNTKALGSVDKFGEKMSNYLIEDELDDLFSDVKTDPLFQEALAELEPGYQIADHRLSKGLTQAELAALAGTSQSSIARLENGSSPPSLSYLRRVAKALDASVEVKIVSSVTDDSQDEEQSALLDAVNYLHEDALEDIQNKKYFDAHDKLETLSNLIEKCDPSRQTQLLLRTIDSEIILVDQLNQLANSLFSIKAGLDNFIEQINTDQSRRQHAHDRAYLSDLAYQKNPISSFENVYIEVTQSRQK
jgi:transcriptional regulator with XRE-family HTH domain